MRRGRIFIYLALIIILGLVAAYVLLQRNAQTPGDVVEEVVAPTPVVEIIEVVVVTQRAPRGTILDETLLTMVEIPKNDAVDGMFFNDLASVVGRRAKFDLDSGIPLTASMLVDSADELSSTGSAAALTIPRGMVAVSIPISRLSSVSYAPQPGDHVSVIVTMLLVDLDSEYQTRLPNEVIQIVGPISNETTNLLTLGMISFDSGTPEKFDSRYMYQGRTELDPLLNELLYVIPPETQRGRLVSQTLLPDVTVLQIGDFQYEKEEEPVIEGEGVAEPVPEPAPEEITTEEQPPDVISLIVTPQDAVSLNYVLFSGAELTLALRGSGDDSSIPTESATLQFLLDEYDITLPAKLPYGMEPKLNDLALPTLLNGLTENPE
jgi:pilus assembly protein CpaB